MKEKEIAAALLNNPRWRLENLYHIIDKYGNRRTFEMNWAQKELYDNLWYCNVILKARQLGISTFVCLLFLDRCLFNRNMSAGIIAHTREDAEYLFKRIKFAYDYLPEIVREKVVATNDSARELVFTNGSSIRVGTSMRGSTLNYLHVSEFGKICAKFPDKAEEIITGSLNTVAPGQYIIIESTAEGRAGHFYDICKKAEKTRRGEESELDFRFHFFPWWKEPAYKTGSNIRIDEDTLEYFTSLQDRGIKLDQEQASWYALKAQTQGDNMMREYPSTSEEAWMSAIDGSYYSKQMNIARAEKRIGFIPYDENLPVHTCWDLGYNDSTAIWFCQLVGKEIRIIDYVEGSGESLAHWLGVVKAKPYVYEKHIAPHDILAHEYSTGMSRQDSARKMGMNFIPSPRVDLLQGIDIGRGILNRCWFDEAKCAEGIKCLENYTKEWDDKRACWKSRPLHNKWSHGADAFRYLAISLPILDQGSYSPNTLGGFKRSSRF